jgi:hypothetical protein
MEMRYLFTTKTIPISNGLIGYWPFNGNANDSLVIVIMG